jgi:Rap1-interacting factor 1 N terminal
MPAIKKCVVFQDPTEPKQTFDTRVETSKGPLKSILKNRGSAKLPERSGLQLSDATILQDIYSSSIDFSQYSNLDTVLEAACHALAENTIGSHLRIYASLNTALRCKESNISSQFLTEKANPLLLYAKRDLQVFEASTDKLDLRVVVQILKVADYLFFSEDIAMTLDFELVKWFLMRGLDVMENNESSKSITAAYLHIFNYQRLPRCLSNDMALRLLKAITTRQPKFTSVGISSEYISVYRLLVQTNPNMMLAHVEEWLPTIIRSLVDPSSLVRHRALQAAQDVNTRFLANKSIGKCVVQVLESPEPERKRVVLEGEPETSKQQPLHMNSGDSPSNSRSPSASPPPSRGSYVVAFTKCITNLLNSQGEGKTALAILSSVMLMLLTWGNGLDERIERWKYIGKLLEVCKLGFNSPYLSTKTATISMWNTVIYIWTAQAFCQYPDQPGQIACDSLSRNIVFLLHPFNKLIQESRPVIAKSLLSTFYSLVNVCMRAPSVSLQDRQWDITWSLVLQPVLVRILESPHLEIRNEAVKILTHLIDARSPSPKNFSARARLLANGPVTLAEIPSFSGKWIKAKSSEVLDMLLMMLKKPCSTELCDKAWNAFLRSAKLVIQREIYTSQETMAQVTAICNFIHACCESKCAAYPNIAYYIHTSIDSIGLTPFSEESVQLTSSNKLLAVNSQRGIKKLSNKFDRSCPIFYLWQWLFTTEIDSYMFEVLTDEFLKFLSSRISTRGKMLSFLALIDQSSEPHYKLWRILVKHSHAQFATTSDFTRTAREFDLDDVCVLLNRITE